MFKRFTACCLYLCFVSAGLLAMELPTRVGLCRPGAAPCSCMQADKFFQFATACHGAPVSAVSWCCNPVLNGLGKPSVHLAIAGEGVTRPVIPGEDEGLGIYIRLYELDLYFLTFKELNSYVVNEALNGIVNSPIVNTLDWCCTENGYYLVAGGYDLTDNHDDVLVFAFDGASWQVTGTTRVPFKAGFTDPVAFQYDTNHVVQVQTVATLCDPCSSQAVPFYLAVGGDTPTIGTKKQVSVVPFMYGNEYYFNTSCQLDMVTGLNTAYSLDWCMRSANSQPLLAVGGEKTVVGICDWCNILVYTFDNICQSSCPTYSLLTQATFDGSLVNSVRWCCNSNLTCPIFPYLAVGGKANDAGMTRIYYINASNYSMQSYAYASTSTYISQINSVDWNPAPCNCSHITAGGCQADCAYPACNIIEYNKVKASKELQEVEETLFDSNVNSLEWCKATTIPANYCAYLAVGTTGTIPCEAGYDDTDQVVIYQATFCKNASPASPCQR